MSLLALLTTVALSCPPTKMENATTYPWNEFDMKTLKHVKTRCGQIYPNSPCVKLFRKWDKKDYSVICGREK